MKRRMDDHQENVSPENGNPWNKRESRSPLRLYLLIGLLCLLLAYVLSQSFSR